MGIVTAEESRLGQYDVYLPSQVQGMAHLSYRSPDGKWVLLVEMNGHHEWTPCRVVPIDGTSPRRLVGPPGAGCTFGAWSPDGRWIYLTSNAGAVPGPSPDVYAIHRQTIQRNLHRIPIR